jgi:hypothetical protein
MSELIQSVAVVQADVLEGNHENQENTWRPYFNRFRYRSRGRAPDEVLQQHSDVRTLCPEDVEISEQLKTMRAEVDRIRESVGLLAEGVKTIVQQMPTMLEEEFSRLVRRNPLTAILSTALLSFGLTLLLTGKDHARSYRNWYES